MYDIGAGVDADGLRTADLSVTIVVAEGDGLGIRTWGRQTVATLAVSSGFTTAEHIASVALGGLDGGHPLDGVLVANPDPADQTTGHVPLALPLASASGAGRLRVP